MFAAGNACACGARRNAVGAEAYPRAATSVQVTSLFLPGLPSLLQTHGRAGTTRTVDRQFLCRMRVCQSMRRNPRGVLNSSRRQRGHATRSQETFVWNAYIVLLP